MSQGLAFSHIVDSGSVSFIVNKYLVHEDLERLFNGEVNAVVVKGYYRSDDVLDKVNIFSSSNLLERYDHELKTGDKVEYLDYGVDRFGVSFNTTYNGCEKAKARYYSSVIKNIRNIRRAFAGSLSPFDRFRLELDEVWSGHVGLANFENKKLMSGIVRVMNRPKDSSLISDQPHVDILPKRYADLEGQFAVNIYLSLPGEGGCLELWNTPPIKAEEADELCAGDWRSRLGESTSIKPEAGDLIIFNSRVPHAVTAFTEGPRVSIQSFIGLCKNKELKLWA